jgi:hypothetical protein
MAANSFIHVQGDWPKRKDNLIKDYFLGSSFNFMWLEFQWKNSSEETVENSWFNSEDTRGKFHTEFHAIYEESSIKFKLLLISAHCVFPFQWKI